jgi:hypothetical protein
MLCYRCDAELVLPKEHKAGTCCACLARVRQWEKSLAPARTRRGFTKLIAKADALELWYDPNVVLPEGTEEVV